MPTKRPFKIKSILDGAGAKVNVVMKALLDFLFKIDKKNLNEVISLEKKRIEKLAQPSEADEIRLAALNNVYSHHFSY